MSKSTAVATRDEDVSLAVPEDVAAAIAAAQAEEWGDEPLSTPMVKIGQGLTREVAEGDADLGEWINSLTGDVYGTVLEFVVAYFNKGRFAADKKSGRSFAAAGSTIPASWAEFVGDEFVGTPFAEYPGAEEAYRAAANAGEIEWGSGPPVSTTYNYTGLVIREDEDPEPVRLSMKRTDTPAHKKLQTLLRAVLRNKSTWDKVVRLPTTAKDFGRAKSYLIDPTGVRFVRDSTPDERLLAAEVATAVMGGRVISAEIEDKMVAPANDGGLGI